MMDSYTNPAKVNVTVILSEIDKKPISARQYVIPIKHQRDRKIIERKRNNLRGKDVVGKHGIITEYNRRESEDDFWGDFDIGESAFLTDGLLSSRSQKYDPVAEFRHAYEHSCDTAGVPIVGKVLRDAGKSTLDLHFHLLGPKGAKALSSPIQMTTTLNTLDLRGSCIGDAGLHSLLPSLIENVSIQELNLAQNFLTSKAAKDITKLLIRKPTIQRLDVSGNRIGNIGLKDMAEAIQETASLKYLNLGDNDLGTKGAKVIGPALAINDTIEVLDLSWNHFRMEGAVALCKSLQDNVRIHQLVLSWNGFCTDGGIALGKALLANSALTTIDLSDNRVDDRAMVGLAKGLEKNIEVENIDLSHNQCSQDGIHAILKAISKNQNSVMSNIGAKGIQFDDKNETYVSLLQTVNEKLPKFAIDYDKYPIERCKDHPVDIVIKYLREQGKKLEDIFGPDSNSTKCLMDRNDFVTILRTAQVPLNENQYETAANYIERWDAGKLNLKYLYKRWDAIFPGEIKFPLPDIEEHTI